MPDISYEVPQEWHDLLDELRERVKSLPEDPEDRAIREYEEKLATLPPEEQARVTHMGDEILKHMLTPANKAVNDQFFREFEQ